MFIWLFTRLDQRHLHWELPSLAHAHKARDATEPCENAMFRCQLKGRIWVGGCMGRLINVQSVHNLARRQDLRVHTKRTRVTPAHCVTPTPRK